MVEVVGFPVKQIWQITLHVELSFMRFIHQAYKYVQLSIH